MTKMKHEATSPGGLAIRRLRLFLYIWFAVLPAFFLSHSAKAQTCGVGCTLGTDLVVSGNFADGCTGSNSPSPFGSSLTYISCTSTNTTTQPLQYSEANTNTISTWNAAGWMAADHSSGGNTNFLIIDGPEAQGQPNGGNRIVWSQNVTVKGGTTYQFSAFFCNLLSPLSSVVFPQFQLQISDPSSGQTIVATGNQISTQNNWVPLCGNYFAMTSKTVIIQILMFGNGTTVLGNDGGVDDISFKPVTIDADFTYGQTSCRHPFMFMANDMRDPQQAWDFGDGTSDIIPTPPPHIFPAPGDYLVTHTVTTPCGTSVVSKIVKVESCCTCITDVDAASPNNKVADGNFAPPCTPNPPYSSDYIRDACSSPQLPPNGHDHFVETLTSTFAGRTYCSVDDHSYLGGTGFLIVDGAINGDVVAVKNGGHPRAWFQTGPTNNSEGYVVDPASSYCFKASFFNPEYQYPAKPSVKMVIKTAAATYTVAVMDFLPYNNECGWTTICGCWKPLHGETLVLELDIILESNDCNNANDLGIDDVIFEPTTQGCNPTCDTQNQQNTGNSLASGGNPTGGMSPVMTKVKSSQTGSTDINVHPIPVTRGQDLHISYHSMADKMVTIQVLSNDGKVQLQMNSQIKLGENELQIKTDSLKPGTYIMRMESGDSLETKTIVVQ